MRSASLTALLLIALALGACGANNDASDAEGTVSSAVTALAKGEAGKACSKLTSAAQKRLIVVLRHNPIGPDIHAKSCEEALTKLHASLSQPIRNSLVDGEVDDAKLNGDKAVVHVVGAGMDVDVQKLDGKWLITGGFLD